MAVQACLNGSRTRSDHVAVPLTPAELAADAVAARQAGAFAVHLHPRAADGSETLDARACDAAVTAIRTAAPSLAVGLSTSATIDPDPFARAAAIRNWSRRPDFVAVNVAELGWSGIVRAALHASVGVEAGLWSTAAAEEFVRSPFTHQVVRVLVESSGDVDEACAISALVPSGVPQLWHGVGPATWSVIAEAAAAGHDVRVGLEDVLTLPGGQPAAGNAELVAAAAELVGRLT